MDRAIVIGAGIAGLSVASSLARRGYVVTVVDREEGAARGSTARSAGIFRLAVAEPINVVLGLRTREIVARVAPGAIRRTGALYPCEDEGLRQDILTAARDAGVRPALPSETPEFLQNHVRPALLAPLDGIVDVTAFMKGLEQEARDAGASFAFGSTVESVDVVGGKTFGVVIAGDRVPAELVVDATGPMSPVLRGADHVDIGVRPHRRHLYALEGLAAGMVTQPVWDLSDGLYLRPDAEGLIASPCDEEAATPETRTAVDPTRVRLLFEKLHRLAPALATLTVRRAWAGVRPLTEDDRFVVGPDPDVSGLFRIGGLGGHGITAGAAAGELLADIIAGARPTEAHELRPERFLQRPSRPLPGRRGLSRIGGYGSRKGRPRSAE